MTNFNNPSNIPSNNTYSVVSATLENPFVTNKVDYGNFTSADPVLREILPKNVNINLGITSPGFVDDEGVCTGLGFINNNPSYDKMPFSVCLDKYNTQYAIPESVFDNLMHNLPYTFDRLSKEEKKKYLSQFKKFIEKEEKSNGSIIDKVKNSSGPIIKKENYVNMTSSKKSNQSDSFMWLIAIIIIAVILIIICMYCFK